MCLHCRFSRRSTTEIHSIFVGVAPGMSQNRFLFLSTSMKSRCTPRNLSNYFLPTILNLYLSFYLPFPCDHSPELRMSLDLLAVCFGSSLTFVIKICSILNPQYTPNLRPNVLLLLPRKRKCFIHK